MKTLFCLLFAILAIKTNAFNQTQFNQTQFNQTQYNQTQFNQTELNQTQFSQTQLNQGCDYIPDNYQLPLNGTFPNVDWLDPTNLCNLKDHPVQSFVEFHGKVWFVMSNYTMTWEEGKSFCESKGLKMARIYSTEENNAMFEIFTRFDRRLQAEKVRGIFLGGKATDAVGPSSSQNKYKCMFTWWSGDKVGDIGWGSSEPNQSGGHEPYLEVVRNAWNDIGYDETMRNYVACEYREGFNLEYLENFEGELGNCDNVEQQEHENNDENNDQHHREQYHHKKKCEGKYVAIGGFMFSVFGAFNFVTNFVFCAMFKCCFPRKFRRAYFQFTSYMLSCGFMIHLVAVPVAFIIELFLVVSSREHCLGQSLLVLAFVPPYIIIALIYAGRSRAWQHLKSVEEIADGKNYNIWKHIKADEAPTISMSISCYHYITVHYTDTEWYTDSDGQQKSRQVQKTRQERVTTWTGSESIAYSTWWIGDGVGDPHEQESPSKTYLCATEGKMIFGRFNYSIKTVDKYTDDAIKAARSACRSRNSHRDTHCDVNVHGWSYKKGPARLTLKPESMELPDFCKPGQYWKYAILPLPYFNGAKIRQIINEDLSIEFTRDIVRYVQIKPDGVKSPQPPMDTTKGYQITNALYSSTNLIA